MIRTKLSLSQPEAATKFKIPLSTWKQYEKGPSEPGSGALRGLSDGGININWVLTGEGNMLLDSSKGASDRPVGYQVDIKGRNEPTVSAEFALLPYYDVEASAGHGCLVDQELETGQMAFRKDWLSQRGLQASKCKLIKARGDSMEPTIYHGDLLLVDTSIESIKDDAIYIVQSDHHLIVKRIQQSLDGSLTIISDNERYKEQTVSPEQAKEIKIAGRVRWYGHEI